VHIDDIEAYDVLYLPLPVMLTAETAERLRYWVSGGGTLIAEGCLAYWGEDGRVGTVQPSLGLDQVFGAREAYVEFSPDLLGELRLNVDGHWVWGGVFMQAYAPTAGQAVDWYEDGRVAAVTHDYGKGRTLLLGTMAGYGYEAHVHKTDEKGASGFWRWLLAWARVAQHVRSSDPRVVARLHAGDGGTYLWVANPERLVLPVTLTLGEAWGPFDRCRTLWGAEAQVEGRTVTLIAGARDFAVLALEES
jgi:beta-galactosidase